MFDMPDEEFKATLQMLVPMVVETMTGRAVIDLCLKKADPGTVWPG